MFRWTLDHTMFVYCQMAMDKIISTHDKSQYTEHPKM